MWMICLLLSLLLARTGHAEQTPMAHTAKGIFTGRAEKGALKFAQLAYAEPPVGKLRWRRPVAASRARQVAAPVQCPQVIGDSLPENVPPLPASEDCLYLNVWTPEAALKAEARLPVVVLVHGGGLLAGSGLKDFYDGSVFARQNVVFVSFNYRLGELGYGPNLEKEPGSLGLLDQGLALTWVKENISAFGGDPEQVFLLGHSKGAEAVTALMISGLAESNVKGGIAFSGPRNFDYGIRPILLQFWPGEQNAEWKPILSRRGFHLYVPDLPAFRNPHQAPWRFRLLVSSLYDEGSGEGGTEQYCANLHFLKQFPYYIDAFHYVWHSPDRAHGAEMVALFTESEFGRKLMHHVLAFIRTGAPPPLYGFRKPELWKENMEEVHVYPSFSFTRRLAFPEGVERSNSYFLQVREICLQEYYGGSRINGWFYGFERILRWWWTPSNRPL
jgi:hypothetical protein